jgi:hypothetical protein
MDAVVSREEKMIYIYHCANFTGKIKFDLIADIDKKLYQWKYELMPL